MKCVVWSGISGRLDPNLKLVLFYHPGTKTLLRLPILKHRSFIALRSGRLSTIIYLSFSKMYHAIRFFFSARHSSTTHCREGTHIVYRKKPHVSAKNPHVKCSANLEHDKIKDLCFRLFVRPVPLHFSCSNACSLFFY